MEKFEKNFELCEKFVFHAKGGHVNKISFFILNTSNRRYPSAY